MNWVTLEENILRERVTTDIATGGGQYDIMTIGNYEVPIWGKQGWLVPLEFDAAYDVDDLLPAIRGGLTVDDKLYAAPFYGESAFIMYRTDLFEAAGLTMPESPTWEFIGEAARKITDRAADINGICLRGKAGWGENMALPRPRWPTRFGARWFDEEWTPQFDQPEWKEALQFYADLMKDAGPPGASSNGFNENLTLFQQGKCGMWIDATVAALLRHRPEELDRRRQGRLTRSSRTRKASTTTATGSGRGTSRSRPRSKNAEAAKTFIAWATDKDYTELVAEKEGWANVPPGTRTSLYENPDYLDAAAFADDAKAAMNAADITKPTVRAGALHRRPVRRDPRVPVDRHHRRPALLGGARRPVERRRRARPGPVGRPSARCAAPATETLPPSALTARPVRPGGPFPRRPRRPRGTTAMATRQTATIARFMRLPSIVLLLIWMIVPLAMTVYFSFRYYNLLNPAAGGWAGFENYSYFLTDPAFWQAIRNTLVHRRSACSLITVIGGIAIALLIDQPIFGQGIVRILVISPFFVMPPVAALVWKNMILHPGYGVFADIAKFFGATPVDWFASYPLVLDHHHRRLAVAALRHADPAHLAAVARQRAEGGGRDGRRRLRQPLLAT